MSGSQRSPLTGSEHDRRVLAVWAADCAERTLPLFEAQAPGDMRPREAIEGVRAFACGDLRIGPVRALANRAHAAAREVNDAAAVAAARAAGHAAADPVLAVGVWPTTRLLRAALRANAVFSVVCGVVLMVAGWWLAEPWGLGPPVAPPLAGAGVAGFGVLVAWLAVQPSAVVRRWAVLVIVADAIWVAGSLIGLVLGGLPLPGSVAVAAAVAGLAVAQAAGLLATRAGDPLADVEVVQAVRVLAAPPAAVWPLISDHGLYGRLAPNLSAVQVISDPGAPLRRRCVNTAGQGWEETCTVWEPGRRFAMEVDTTDYPNPLTLVQGLWQVDPHPAGSRVTMRFAYRATPSLWGGLFAIALRALFPLALRRILDGWQRIAAAVGELHDTPAG